MSAHSRQFQPFAERMRAERLPEVFIDTFAYYYAQLVEGQTGLIPESAIEPVDDLPDAASLPGRLDDAGRAALGQTVVIKLNGGLGTSMGLERAKSLLTVKDNLSFLDIIARQAIHDGVPLVLMNSFVTDTDSRAVLENHPELESELPARFLQHKEPKITRSDLSPATWPANPSLEWCPPGHGDIYAALLTSGTLDALLSRGYRYAFVSNSDNLGAVMDVRILGTFAEQELPFMMEVADRTDMDRKGGHLARTSDGQLLLRESAQCPPEDEVVFRDISRHRYFNTNNLWIDLRVLQQVLEERHGRLGLPMIRNTKRVDPRDSDSTPVYQLETAMGSAIGAFAGAGALYVPRSRFAPVKKTDGLLAVRSDAFVLTDDFRIVPHPARSLGPLVVDLDPQHYRFVTDLDARFPFGAPSCVECRRLTVRGDVRFGRDVTLRGDVKLVNETGTRVEVPDESLIEGEHHF